LGFRLFIDKRTVPKGGFQVILIVKGITNPVFQIFKMLVFHSPNLMMGV